MTRGDGRGDGASPSSRCLDGNDRSALPSPRPDPIPLDLAVRKTSWDRREATSPRKRTPYLRHVEEKSTPQLATGADSLRAHDLACEGLGSVM
jgi:hypothetical protein